jgi:hypothetical protein
MRLVTTTWLPGRGRASELAAGSRPTDGWIGRVFGHKILHQEHQESDHQIPGALEQVDNLDTAKWASDIADDLANT